MAGLKAASPNSYLSKTELVVAAAAGIAETGGSASSLAVVQRAKHEPLWLLDGFPFTQFSDAQSDLPESYILRQNVTARLADVVAEAGA